MADTKISDEVTITPLDGTEEVLLASGGANGKTTTQDIADLGGGGGTPGGLSGQVQYNDGGAFAGDADMTFDGSTLTSRRNTMGMILFNGSENSFRASFGYYDANMRLSSNEGYAFSSQDNTDNPGSIDTMINRNAAGVVEINNATPGTFRDILTRGLRSNAVAFASAIGSPVEGTLQAFTDSSTATWGDTITGGGANHVLGYYNGTNWTVAAK